MLTNIIIKGFKSIYHLEELALGQVNVFVGANGSGKSNLLEAIGVLSTATSGINIDSESLGRRGVRLSPNELYRTNLMFLEGGAMLAEFVLRHKHLQIIFFREQNKKSDTF